MEQILKQANLRAAQAPQHQQVDPSVRGPSNPKTRAQHQRQGTWQNQNGPLPRKASEEESHANVANHPKPASSFSPMRQPGQPNMPPQPYGQNQMREPPFGNVGPQPAYQVVPRGQGISLMVQGGSLKFNQQHAQQNIGGMKEQSKQVKNQRQSTGPSPPVQPDDESSIVENGQRNQVAIGSRQAVQFVNHHSREQVPEQMASPFQQMGVHYHKIPSSQIFDEKGEQQQRLNQLSLDPPIKDQEQSLKYQNLRPTEIRTKPKMESGIKQNQEGAIGGTAQLPAQIMTDKEARQPHNSIQRREHQGNPTRAIQSSKVIAALRENGPGILGAGPHAVQPWRPSELAVSTQYNNTSSRTNLRNAVQNLQNEWNQYLIAQTQGFDEGAPESSSRQDQKNEDNQDKTNKQQDPFDELQMLEPTSMKQEQEQSQGHQIDQDEAMGRMNLNPSPLTIPLTEQDQLLRTSQGADQNFGQGSTFDKIAEQEMAIDGSMARIPLVGQNQVKDQNEARKSFGKELSKPLTLNTSIQREQVEDMDHKFKNKSGETGWVQSEGGRPPSASANQSSGKSSIVDIGEPSSAHFSKIQKSHLTADQVQEAIVQSQKGEIPPDQNDESDVLGAAGDENIYNARIHRANVAAPQINMNPASKAPQDQKSALQLQNNQEPSESIRLKNASRLGRDPDSDVYAEQDGRARPSYQSHRPSSENLLKGAAGPVSNKSHKRAPDKQSADMTQFIRGEGTLDNRVSPGSQQQLERIEKAMLSKTAYRTSPKGAFFVESLVRPSAMMMPSRHSDLTGRVGNLENSKDISPSQHQYVIESTKFQDQEMQVDFSTQTFDNRSHQSTSPFPTNLLVDLQLNKADNFKNLNLNDKMKFLKQLNLTPTRLQSMQQAVADCEQTGQQQLAWEELLHVSSQQQHAGLSSVYQPSKPPVQKDSLIPRFRPPPEELKIVMIIQAPTDLKAGCATGAPKRGSLGRRLKSRPDPYSSKAFEKYDQEDLQEYYLTLADLRSLLKIQNDCKYKLENRSKNPTKLEIHNKFEKKGQYYSNIRPQTTTLMQSLVENKAKVDEMQGVMIDKFLSQLHRKGQGRRAVDRLADVGVGPGQSQDQFVNFLNKDLGQSSQTLISRAPSIDEAMCEANQKNDKVQVINGLNEIRQRESAVRVGRRNFRVDTGSIHPLVFLKFTFQVAQLRGLRGIQATFNTYHAILNLVREMNFPNEEAMEELEPQRQMPADGQPTERTQQTILTSNIGPDAATPGNPSLHRMRPALANDEQPDELATDCRSNTKAGSAISAFRLSAMKQSSSYRRDGLPNQAHDRVQVSTFNFGSASQNKDHEQGHARKSLHHGPNDTTGSLNQQPDDQRKVSAKKLSHIEDQTPYIIDLVTASNENQPVRNGDPGPGVKAKYNLRSTTSKIRPNAPNATQKSGLPSQDPKGGLAQSQINFGVGNRPRGGDMSGPQHVRNRTHTNFGYGSSGMASTIGQSQHSPQAIKLKSAEGFLSDLDQKKKSEERQKSRMLIQRHKELRASKSQALKRRFGPGRRTNSGHYDQKLTTEPMMDVYQDHRDQNNYSSYLKDGSTTHGSNANFKSAMSHKPYAQSLTQSNFHIVLNPSLPSQGDSIAYRGHLGGVAPTTLINSRAGETVDQYYGHGGAGGVGTGQGVSGAARSGSIQSLDSQGQNQEYGQLTAKDASAVSASVPALFNLFPAQRNASEDPDYGSRTDKVQKGLADFTLHRGITPGQNYKSFHLHLKDQNQTGGNDILQRDLSHDNSKPLWIVSAKQRRTLTQMDKHQGFGQAKGSLDPSKISNQKGCEAAAWKKHSIVMRQALRKKHQSMQSSSFAAEKEGLQEIYDLSQQIAGGSIIRRSEDRPEQQDGRPTNPQMRNAQTGHSGGLRAPDQFAKNQMTEAKPLNHDLDLLASRKRGQKASPETLRRGNNRRTHTQHLNKRPALKGLLGKQIVKHFVVQNSAARPVADGPPGTGGTLGVMPGTLSRSKGSSATLQHQESRVGYPSAELLMISGSHYTTEERQVSPEGSRRDAYAARHRRPPGQSDGVSAANFRGVPPAGTKYMRKAY